MKTSPCPPLLLCLPEPCPLFYVLDQGLASVRGLRVRSRRVCRTTLAGHVPGGGGLRRRPQRLGYEPSDNSLCAALRPITRESQLERNRVPHFPMVKVEERV